MGNPFACRIAGVVKRFVDFHRISGGGIQDEVL
jgi:hypothetical protein